MKKESVFAFEKSSDSTGFLLWQVTNLWQREIKKILEPFDLTHTQFVLLASIFWLKTQDKDATQVNIADHAKTDVMMTSKVLRTLEDKGYLNRKEHPQDTRAKIVALTAKGKELLASALPVVEAFDQKFFGQLKEQVPVLNEYLNRLIG